MLKVLDTATVEDKNLLVFEDQGGNIYNVLTDEGTYNNVKQILSQLDDVLSSSNKS